MYLPDVMKIYTKTGDQGKTGLIDRDRIDKDSLRIEAIGEVDELNALLGVVRSETLPESLHLVLEQIQHGLFDLGAELATVDAATHGVQNIGAAEIQILEAEIDRYQQTLPSLKQLILPAGTRAAANLFFARAVCRRAERRLVALANSSDETLSEHLVIYLNRLGDLLFVLARVANLQAGQSDVPWLKDR